MMGCVMREGDDKGFGGGLWAGELAELIVHCRGLSVGRYTPSDFGLPSTVGYGEWGSFLSEQGEPFRPGDVYGLSRLQEGLLFHGIYSKESRAYMTQNKR